ncbi:MAG: diacylglycerol/lipid kinase family protein [Ruminococcus sp.]
MYYFIINPKSRSGAGLKLWQKVHELLSAEHVLFRSFFTKCPGHATSLSERISDHLKSGDTLVVLGGDGTLNEVFNGLKYPQITTFAYIPTGSGNDFARGMGLATDIREAVKAILSPSEIRKLDICRCRTENSRKKFGISSGLGFDAGICHEALSSPLKNFLNKIKLGKLTYTIIALRQLLFFRPFTLQIITDGQKKATFKKVYFAAAMNLKYEGGGFQFCPDAEPDDGYLDLFLVHNLPKPKILLLLPTAFWGKHTRFKGIRLLRCRRALLLSDRELPVHIDGESAGFSSSVLMTASSEQLNVIVK